jgi:hypothetical protein
MRNAKHHQDNQIGESAERRLEARRWQRRLATEENIQMKNDSKNETGGEFASKDLLGCGEWPTMPLMTALGGSVNHEWHVAINQHSQAQLEAKQEWPGWMYSAKEAAEEVPRLALLLSQERQGTLCKTFRRCSCCSDQKHVVDNHLTCCLGTECRKCPHLAALDKADMPPEQRDWIKAWTCVAHILANGGDRAGDGFLTTVDARMYREYFNESLASSMFEQPNEKS